MAVMTKNELKESVMSLMHVGYPPSKIDKELRLAPGRAREIVVGHWWETNPKHMDLLIDDYE